MNRQAINRYKIIDRYNRYDCTAMMYVELRYIELRHTFDIKMISLFRTRQAKLPDSLNNVKIIYVKQKYLTYIYPHLVAIMDYS